MQSKIEFLEKVKFMFDIMSDHSTKCGGYRNLLKMIEDEQKNINNITSNEISIICPKCGETLHINIDR